MRAIASKQDKQLLWHHEEVLLITQDANNLQHVMFHLPVHSDTIKVVFKNVPVGAGIWIYEFNLKAASMVENLSQGT